MSLIVSRLRPVTCAIRPAESPAADSSRQIPRLPIRGEGARSRSCRNRRRSHGFSSTFNGFMPEHPGEAVAAANGFLGAFGDNYSYLLSPLHIPVRFGLTASERRESAIRAQGRSRPARAAGPANTFASTRGHLLGQAEPSGPSPHPITVGRGAVRGSKIRPDPAFASIRRRSFHDSRSTTSIPVPGKCTGQMASASPDCEGPHCPASG